MNETRYLISDASKKVDVETHVLRYWEEELGLSIPRNEMGHRYYTEFHIRLFCQIKNLKDRGYQLKAIKNALQQVMARNQGFMQAEGVLEEDMARTLQEKQAPVPMESKDNGLPEGITWLADYNRLEPEGQASQKQQSEEENREEKIQNKPEFKEKDGQTEMKKKGKNRKKLSAWERRNGMVGNEQESIRKDSEKAFQETVFQEMEDGEEVQEIEWRQNGSQERENQEGNNQESGNAQKNYPKDNGQEKDNQESDGQNNNNQENNSQNNNDQENDSENNNSRESYSLKEGEMDKENRENGSAELVEVAESRNTEILFISQDEKMQQFQKIMNYIIGHALEANNEKLSQEISSRVNQCLSGELEELMRIRDERDEERFRQFDEIIRSYQRDSQGKAEAAAARIPFFRKKRFKKHRPPQNV